MVSSAAAADALTVVTSSKTTTATTTTTTAAAVTLGSVQRPGLRDPLCIWWTRCTQWLHHIISGGVTACALHAVKYPKTYIVVISVVSLALITAGLLTNFELVLDLDQVLTPVNSKPQQHADWIYSDQGFPNQTRLLQMILYNDGHDVLHVPQARRVLEAVETIRTTPGYHDLCRQGVYRNFDNELTCRIFSVSGYWTNHFLVEFDATTKTDEDLRHILSGREFADGSPVLHDAIVGNYQKDANGTLTTAQSYLIRLELPDLESTTNHFERDMLHRLDQLRREWRAQDASKSPTDPTRLDMDFVTIFAYQIEFFRAILGDLYLVAISALLMVGFTCLMFYRKDPTKSRAALGVASVVTIGCSILAGNGLMFVLGVPYSTVHQMLPFIIFGIGLDDTFIITGAYFRTHPQDAIELRIQQTMQEVGWSISVTTLTTIFAFMLGYFSSSFPGVHWLCLSAVTTIGIDFYFQITYFVAWLVLDERRLQAGKRDGCYWMDLPKKLQEEEEEVEEVEEEVEEVEEHHNNAKRDSSKEEDEEEASEEAEETHQQEAMVVHRSIRKAPMPPPEVIKPSTKRVVGVIEPEPHPDDHDALVELDPRPLPEKLMAWYADILLIPTVKVIVLILFGLFFAVCCVSATRMTQEFDVGSYVTEDSYLRNIFTSLNDYSSVVRPIALYFRHVNQSTPEMQQQMIDYVTDMEALPQVWSLDNITTEGNDPFTTGIDKVRPFCWVRDFRELDRYFEDQPVVQAVFDHMTFNEKLDFLLQDRIIREVYGQDIVRDADGNLVTSRCYLFLQDIDLKDVEAQIDMLFDQRDVTLAQPINQLEEHQKDWAFFAYDELFGYWEAYSVSVDELVFTMIAGVVAVTFISFVFIPHWTGVLLVCPLIILLYINMLGSLNFLGLHINGITYVCVVVSIGLLVDFLIHVLLRYYECAPGKTRDERVRETLETMGASILIGGTTTFLAVVPIAASSVKIFLTVFNSFFAMVTLGVSHGLILLPVILSLVGPTTNVRHVGMPGQEQEEEEGGHNKHIAEIPSANTGRTLVSFSMEDFDYEEEIDVDDIRSLTDSVVQEVCTVNDNISGSPTSAKSPPPRSEISC